MPLGSALAKRMYGITWFWESRSHIAEMSPVEMKERLFVAFGACHTVVSSVFGKQFHSIVASSGLIHVLAMSSASFASIAGDVNVRSAAGGRTRPCAAPQAPPAPLAAAPRCASRAPRRTARRRRRQWRWQWREGLGWGLGRRTSCLGASGGRRPGGGGSLARCGRRLELHFGNRLIECVLHGVFR